MTALRARLALIAGLAAGACVAPTTQSAGPAIEASPPTYSLRGLESVMGRTARVLEAEFGTPELDVREGGGRMLQFSSAACVLDAYLYARSAGSDAVVTHVDARLPDGRDIDRASCVASLLSE